MPAQADEQQGRAEQTKSPASSKGPDQDQGKGGGDTSKTFTQDQVNTLLADQKRSIQAKFADYDELKVKAEGSKSVEDQLVDLKAKLARSEQIALRNDIATRHGVTAEDRDLFLTGADADTLTAQAKRLAERDSDRKKKGNVAPAEGGNPTPRSDDPNRQFLRDMLGRSEG